MQSQQVIGVKACRCSVERGCGAMPVVDEAIGGFFVRMHDAPSDTRSKKRFS
jgi:hypothetical protein